MNSAILCFANFAKIVNVSFSEFSSYCFFWILASRRAVLGPLVCLFPCFEYLLASSNIVIECLLSTSRWSRYLGFDSEWNRKYLCFPFFKVCLYIWNNELHRGRDKDLLSQIVLTAEAGTGWSHELCCGSPWGWQEPKYWTSLVCFSWYVSGKLDWKWSNDDSWQCSFGMLALQVVG